MITRCAHYEDGRQIPCPPMCPCQQWPHAMFRLTIFGHWKLRRRERRRHIEVIPLQPTTTKRFGR